MFKPSKAAASVTHTHGFPLRPFPFYFSYIISCRSSLIVPRTNSGRSTREGHIHTYIGRNPPTATPKLYLNVSRNLCIIVPLSRVRLLAACALWCFVTVCLWIYGPVRHYCTSTRRSWRRSFTPDHLCVLCFCVPCTRWQRCSQPTTAPPQVKTCSEMNLKLPLVTRRSSRWHDEWRRARGTRTASGSLKAVVDVLWPPGAAALRSRLAHLHGSTHTTLATAVLEYVRR